MQPFRSMGQDCSRLLIASATRAGDSTRASDDQLYCCHGNNQSSQLWEYITVWCKSFILHGFQLSISSCLVFLLSKYAQTKAITFLKGNRFTLMYLMPGHDWKLACRITKIYCLLVLLPSPCLVPKLFLLHTLIRSSLTHTPLPHGKLCNYVVELASSTQPISFYLFA